MIGPGRFIAIVGPSGAGKDSLLTAAAAHFAGDPRLHFPRRLVTRPPSAAEDNVEIAADAFARRLAAGGFAVSWNAHGHSYGLPITLEDQLRKGRDVLCNVSRAVVPEVRARYAASLVIEVTAPAALLSARLAARGRSSDTSLLDRLSRTGIGTASSPDLVIHNDGSLQDALSALLRAIGRRSIAPASTGAEA